MDYVARHLMALYGIEGASMALQFPRLPPSISHPTEGTMPRPQPIREILPKTRLEDYAGILQRRAAGLLSMTDPGIIPPGHPLYNRYDSVEMLRAENAKLQKENLKLRRRLGAGGDPDKVGLGKHSYS